MIVVKDRIEVDICKFIPQKDIEEELATTSGK